MSYEKFGATILAESNYERLTFNYEHLGDIGDEVRIVINGDWRETDPTQVYVTEWSPVE